MRPLFNVVEIDCENGLSPSHNAYDAQGFPRYRELAENRSHDMARLCIEEKH